jgi:hypothetical protein
MPIVLQPQTNHSGTSISHQRTFARRKMHFLIIIIIKQHPREKEIKIPPPPNPSPGK